MNYWSYFKQNWRMNVWNATMAALLLSTLGIFFYTRNFWLALAAAALVVLVWIVASFYLIETGKFESK